MIYSDISEGFGFASHLIVGHLIWVLTDLQMQYNLNPLQIILEELFQALRSNKKKQKNLYLKLKLNIHWKELLWILNFQPFIFDNFDDRVVNLFFRQLIFVKSNSQAVFRNPCGVIQLEV